MAKIDRRRNYYLMLDTETANTFTNENNQLDTGSALVYDFGYAVIDKKGNIYKTASYINKDVFLGMKEVMRSAYYANKLPQYWIDIVNNKRQLASLYEIRKDIADTIKEYDIVAVVAHNARFDYNACNSTERYITKSKYRYFFPYGTKIFDTLKMARQVILSQPSYKKWCVENGFMTANNRPKATAEILYRYISGNEDFDEAHTAFEDVEIEAKIFAHCMRQHKKMDKELWSNKERG